ncbi:tellurite resistance protein TerA [Parafrankia irregularis]|uniref:Tellurite resistance protein TerA n=1 Tax=Parafrankia irregularis TaxID=795642 RepID=A0A0S4QZ36_9ACTN|nr:MULTISPECIES: Tellurium resistance [Parafrankia]MBE3205338.1 Tellurium resistance [Parafrankia sp. CH37]CUU60739.1 tellurite resistance protein TerA [Parafrankia irregularis]
MGIDYSKRPAAPPAGAPVSLSKVTLTKSAPTVSLSKQGGGGRLHVNLNWSQNGAGSGAAKGGFLKRVLSAAGGGIDLDLACLFELADGRRGVVQALGNAFGSFDNPPYVQLDADDRTGATAGGENLHVNLARIGEIRRLLVFAFIYEGVASFDQANAVVTLTPAQGAPIEVHLDEKAGGSRMCAIALLTNTGNDFTVSREVRYVGGHRELDSAFGWGLNWTAGRK